MKTEKEDMTSQAEAHGRRLAMRNALGLVGVTTLGAMLVATKDADATRVTLNPSGTPVFRFFDVTDYGARGDGVTDDTTAFAQSVSAISVAGGGVLLVPPGIYILRDSLRISNVALAIVGSGKDQSILKWTSSGGLSFKNSLGYHYSAPAVGKGRSLSISGITFMTDLQGGGNAIDASFLDSTSMEAFVTLSDVRICGSGKTSREYWNNGIVVTNGNGVKLKNVYVIGNTVVSNNALSRPWGCEAGIRLQGGTSNGKISHFLSDIGIERCNTALSVGGWYEGIYLSNFEFAYVSVGVQEDGYIPPGAASGNPNFFAQNGHINFRVSGGAFSNVFNVKLSNVDLYKDGAYSGSGFNGNALSLSNCPNFSVVACKFESTSPPAVDENAIYANGSSGFGVISASLFARWRSSGSVVDSTGVNVSNNIFKGCGTGVFLNQTSANCVARNNVFDGNVVNLTNLGVGNQV